MITRDAVLSHTRRGGDTLRYHAWPTLRQQTVADHTWNVLRIYMEAFYGVGDKDKIIKFIMYHDVAELHVGDPPFPVKANNPVLKAAYDAIETRACEIMGYVLPELSAKDKQIVKVCDLTDMFEFGLNESMLGNALAHPIIHDTLDAAIRVCPRLYLQEYVVYLSRSVNALSGGTWNNAIAEMIGGNTNVPSN